MSATLFDIYDSRAHGATIQDPSGALEVKLTINGFVDDTNSSVNKWHPQRNGMYSSLLAKVQYDAQLWADLVHTSGGKLELSKCSSMHFLSFDFDADGTPHVSLAQNPSVTLFDPLSNQPTILRTLNTHMPHKTLGHWKAPAGTSRTQLKTLCDKIQILNFRIATSSLSRYGARLAYHAIVVASLCYVLVPQCHFTYQELRKAEKIGLAPLVAKCGFSSRTPHALLFASGEYGGGGFIHWDVLQGVGQILLFLKHWRTDTDLSTTLQINLAWCQWQAGIGESILVRTDLELSYLEARWLPSMRKALPRFRAKIHIEPNFVVPPERTDDSYLMNLALNHPTLTDKDIWIINYCRLYLHVTTVSEILDASGTEVLPLMWKCHRPPWFDTSPNVIIQHRPSKFQIKTRWQPFCKYVLQQLP